MIEPAPENRTALTIRRIFEAPRLKVFRAWTEPAALLKWFRAFGMGLTACQVDLKVGGSFRFDLQPPEGPASSITGTYLEIVAPEKLVFTWSSPATADRDTLVTVLFREWKNSTEVILTHERFDNQEMVEAHQQGWSSIVLELATYLETA